MSLGAASMTPTPTNETDRLQALLNYKVLDTPPEVEFDSLVSLASYISGTPVAMISLVDSDRQWFKAKIGTTVRSEEHTSELQSQFHLVCRLLLEKKKKTFTTSVHCQHDT